jgi:hypothetical protein
MTNTPSAEPAVHDDTHATASERTVAAEAPVSEAAPVLSRSLTMTRGPQMQQNIPTEAQMREITRPPWRRTRADRRDPGGRPQARVPNALSPIS